MRKRGTHYWVVGMARAQCGVAVNVGRVQSTGQIENVTCGRCLRALKAENDRGPPAQHWLRVASLYQNTALCGQPVDGVAMATSFSDVTCGQCLRLAAANPQLKGRPAPECQHDVFRAPNTVRLESHPMFGARLRCRVCQATATVYKSSGKITPAGILTEPPNEAGSD